LISSRIAANVVDFHDHVGHATNIIQLVLDANSLSTGGNHN